ncbi:MAG: response regulator transcription factor [Longispora sp.]|nr:response regulator transcription factor [Longispora sp. (in: high G+C Gram-positive bacteria)]
MVYTRVPVFLYAADPISQAGLCAELRSRPEVLLVEENESTSAKVCIVALENWDETSVKILKTAQSRGSESLILVINSLNDTDLLSAVEAGVSALVWRSEATASHLAHTVIQVASGHGALPPEVLGRLLKKVSRLQQNVLSPMGINLAGLSSREADVLSLMAQGHNTHEIAQQLCYSERTVTNILHDVTSRFQLKNRTHAVAYAMREGLI